MLNRVAFATVLAVLAAHLLFALAALGLTAYAWAWLYNQLTKVF